MLYSDKEIIKKISRYTSLMQKEKLKFGQLNDGAGKRFLLFELYYLLGDHEKSKEYISWYTEEFPEDCWGPIQLLPWALILYEMGEPENARRKLAELMLANLYFIPQIIGLAVQEYDMWHSSNMEYLNYFECVSPYVLDKITQEEKDWMSELYHSDEFIQIRNRHIEINKALQYTRDIEERRILIEEADRLLDKL